MKSYFLYDGECGACTYAVRFLLHFSKSNEFYFSSLNSEFSMIKRMKGQSIFEVKQCIIKVRLCCRHFRTVVGQFQWQKFS